LCHTMLEEKIVFDMVCWNFLHNLKSRAELGFTCWYRPNFKLVLLVKYYNFYITYIYSIFFGYKYFHSIYLIVLYILNFNLYLNEKCHFDIIYFIIAHKL
jgi:hypothetical protein